MFGSHLAGGSGLQSRVESIVVRAWLASESTASASLTVGQAENKVRSEYSPIVSAVEGAGYFVTCMPLDARGDRIVCAGKRRDDGTGFTGNSFWLAERNGAWFLGSWGGLLYRLVDATSTSEIAVAWLRLNSSRTAWDVPDELKLKYNLLVATDEEFDSL